MKHLNNFIDFISESYNKPRKGMKRRWSTKYKKSINCNNPSIIYLSKFGFLQKYGFFLI